MFATTSTSAPPVAVNFPRPIKSAACTGKTVMYTLTAYPMLAMPPQPAALELSHISTPQLSAACYNRSTMLLWGEISMAGGKLRQSILQLDEIAALQDNWNGNGAAAFSPAIIRLAKELVSTLSVQPVILPTGRDSIQMEYENDQGDYLEFELFENGRLKMFSYTHDGIERTKDISFAAMNQEVCGFYGRVVL